LIVSDCTLTAPTILGIAENFGTITLRNVVFTPSLSGVWWNSPQPSRICALLRPSPSSGTVTYVGSSLSIENCVISRNSDTEVAAVVVENNANILSLAFNGFSVADARTYSALPVLLEIAPGSVGQLVLESLKSNQITAPVWPFEFGCIGSVSGAGVLATGWEFPDAVMADGVPYLSASTGLPSIKVEGVVEPYPP